MDTTQLLKGVLDLTVLSVVDDEDGYGYDVLRRLRTGGLTDVGDASVYGTLRRLYAAGALTSYVVPSEEGPHRKYYGITPAGRDQLAPADEGVAQLLRHRHVHPRPNRRQLPMNDTQILAHPRRRGIRRGGARRGSATSPTSSARSSSTAWPRT